MSGHTKGSWQTDIDGETAYVVDPDGNMAVCKVMYARPEGQANARLIAAAPDLLEALESCLSALIRETAAGSHLSAEIAQARAAIAKAKGE